MSVALSYSAPSRPPHITKAFSPSSTARPRLRNTYEQRIDAPHDRPRLIHRHSHRCAKKVDRDHQDDHSGGYVSLRQKAVASGRRRDPSRYGQGSPDRTKTCLRGSVPRPRETPAGIVGGCDGPRDIRPNINRRSLCEIGMKRIGHLISSDSGVEHLRSSTGENRGVVGDPEERFTIRQPKSTGKIGRFGNIGFEEHAHVEGKIGQEHAADAVVPIQPPPSGCGHESVRRHNAATVLASARHSTRGPLDVASPGLFGEPMRAALGSDLLLIGVAGLSFASLLGDPVLGAREALTSRVPG